MAWIIKRFPPTATSRDLTDKGRVVVMNDYTGEPKLFDTLEAAKSYATLSCFNGPEYEELK